MKRTGTLLIVCPFILLFTVAICGAQQYTILDLGTLGCTESSAHGINNSGQVVGDSCLSGSTMVHGFRTNANAAINPGTDDLGSLVADRQSHGYAINDSGQVAGMGNDLSGGGRAFRTAPNSSINPATDDLGLPYSYAVAINSSGQVAGYYFGASAPYPVRPFRTAANALISLPDDDLGSLGGNPTFATGMNNLGQVVGYSDAGPGVNRAFRTTATGRIDASSDLGTLGGTSAYATAINDLGQVVGHSRTATGQEHAFRTAGNAVIAAENDLGTLGGAHSYAYAINKSGQVVGSAYTANDLSHAFLWTEQSGIKDLNTLVPSSSGWILMIATGINDNGQIAGYGYPCADFNCAYHAFLLTPAVTTYAAQVRQPIDADESSIFSAKRGVVPVKFVLSDNGAPTCALPPATISVKRTAGGTVGPVDEGIYLTKADSGSNFRIDPTACQYIYNLAVSSLALGKYRADINIDGNSVGYAVFELK